MLPLLLRVLGPGGLPFIEYLGLGLKGGTDEAFSSNSVLVIENANSLDPRVTIQPRDNAVLTRTQVVEMGLAQARLIPHAVGSAISTSPQIAYEVAKPILDLANATGSHFRRADLPRVTGLEGLPTLTELIADYLAGANVAAGFPDPPPLFNPALLGPISPELLERLGQAGSELLSQIWGLLANRENRYTPFPYTAAPNTTQITPPGNTVGGTLTLKRLASIGVSSDPRIGAPDNGPYNCAGTNVINFTAATKRTINNIKTITGPRIIPFAQEAGSPYPDCGTLKDIVWDIVNTSDTASVLSSSDLGSAFGWFQFPEYELTWSGPGAITVQPQEDTWTGLPERNILPDPTATPNPNLLAPVQTTAETQTIQNQQITSQTTTTTVDANTGSTTGAAATAANTSTGTVAASLPALPAYLPAIGTALGTQTGTQTQTQTQVVPVTPTTAVKIGTKLFDGATAATSAVAVAQELLRIEKKIEAIMQPGDTPDIPWLELLQFIANQISIASTGNTWTLTEVCPPPGTLPEDWEPTIYEFEVPGVPVVNIGLAQRLDTIAEMLQVHKNLRQPVCKSVPIGQPVQVQFIQNEEQWETPP